MSDKLYLNVKAINILDFCHERLFWNAWKACGLILHYYKLLFDDHSVTQESLFLALSLKNLVWFAITTVSSYSLLRLLLAPPTLISDQGYLIQSLFPWCGLYKVGIVLMSYPYLVYSIISELYKWFILWVNRINGVYYEWTVQVVCTINERCKWFNSWKR